MHSPITTPRDVLMPDIVPQQQHVLHRDFETRSSLLLKTVGTHRYASDPRSEILCVAFAVDNDPAQLWLPGDPVPPEFTEAACNPSWVVAAHNDSFETAIEGHILGPRYGFPLVPPERHRCTMATALALGLPARLDAVADALELSNRKDAAGQRLMLQMTKPRRARKDEDATGALWFDDDERLNRLYSYCRQDVETERELFERLAPLSPSEHALWLLSGAINDRGFHIDRAFAEAARKIAQAAAPEIDLELAELTGGAVSSIGQIARMQSWLAQQNCTVKTLDKKAIKKLLAQATCRRQCDACWSCARAVPKLQSRNSMRCSHVPVPTIACAAHSSIMAQHRPMERRRFPAAKPEAAGVGRYRRRNRRSSDRRLRSM